MNIFSIIKSEWKKNLIHMSVILLGSLATTGFGLASSNLLTAVSEKNINMSKTWIIIMLISSVIWSLQIFLEAISERRTIEAMNFNIRSEISEKIMSLSYADFHENEETDYVSWLINDISTIDGYGFGNLYMIIYQIFTILLGAYILLDFHFSIIVTILLLSVLMFIVPRFFTKKLNEQMLTVTESNERLTTSYSDVLNGYDALSVLDRKKYFQNAIELGSNNVALEKYKYAKIAGGLSSSSNGVSLLSQVILLAQAVYLVLAYNVDIGIITACTYFGSFIFANLVGINANWIEFKSVDKIFEKFNNKTKRTSKYSEKKVKELENSILLKDITYQYEKDNEEKVLFNNLNLEFKKNKKHIILGDSGTGKSTILNIILGRLSPIAGQVLYDGVDYNELNQESLQRQILYLDQRPYIFNDTIYNNLTLGEEYTDEKIKEVLKKVHLDSWVKSRKDGINTEISYNSKNMSGGERQKLVLARGLLADRRIVLMGEATSAIDKNTALEIEKLIMTDPDLTVVMVTHNLRSEISELVDFTFNL